MHPELAKLLARYHTEQLLDEAASERLAALSRSRELRRHSSGSTPAWRRSVGWAIIDLGVRLAGGSVAPAAGQR